MTGNRLHPITAIAAGDLGVIYLYHHIGAVIAFADRHGEGVILALGDRGFAIYGVSLPFGQGHSIDGDRFRLAADGTFAVFIGCVKTFLFAKRADTVNPVVCIGLSLPVGGTACRAGFGRLAGGIRPPVITGRSGHGDLGIGRGGNDAGGIFIAISTVYPQVISASFRKRDFGRSGIISSYGICVICIKRLAIRYRITGLLIQQSCTAHTTGSSAQFYGQCFACNGFIIVRDLAAVHKIMKTRCRVPIETPAGVGGKVHEVTRGQHALIHGDTPPINSGIFAVDVIIHVAVSKSKQAAFKENGAGFAADAYIVPVIMLQNGMGINHQMEGGDLRCSVTVCIIGKVAQSVAIQIDFFQLVQRHRYIGQTVQIAPVMGCRDIDGIALSRKGRRGQQRNCHGKSQKQAQQSFFHVCTSQKNQFFM